MEPCVFSHIRMYVNSVGQPPESCHSFFDKEEVGNAMPEGLEKSKRILSIVKGISGKAYELELWVNFLKFHEIPDTIKINDGEWCAFLNQLDDLVTDILPTIDKAAQISTKHGWELTIDIRDDIPGGRLAIWDGPNETDALKLPGDCVEWDGVIEVFKKSH